MSKERNEIHKEILEGIPSPIHGLINAAPRVGKTKLGITLLKREKAKKVLWVTPSTKLRDEDLPKEFLKWRAKGLLQKTTFICYKSLHDHKGDYDIIVLDEYQDITEANTEPFFNGSIKYNSILGLSGTHPKHWDKQEILDRLNLKVIVKIGIDEAIEKGLIADYNINIVECTTNNTLRNIKAGNKVKSWMQTEREAYSYLSRNVLRPMGGIRRMKFIYDSFTKEEVAKTLINSLSGRKLVFCSSIAQAERLGNGNTYHSKTNNIKLTQFINQEIDDLFCVKAGGTGFTYENIDNLIIVQADSDMKGDTTQKLARSLLSQGKEYKGNIWFICLIDTKDKDWLEEALKNLNSTKIKFIKSNELRDGIEQRSSEYTTGA